MAIAKNHLNDGKKHVILELILQENFLDKRFKGTAIELSND
jgi:hypothetical protein